MISKVTIQNFKRFKDPTEFNLHPDGVTFIAGGNNSGKSTLLQALAVWEYARSVIEKTRTRGALNAGWRGQDVGVSAAQFSPIALPSLKYLWSNLQVMGGAIRSSMRIRCDWQITGAAPQLRFLEFGLALHHDQLYLKPTDSNLAAGDKIPRLEYLPTFAGIGPHEKRMLLAVRKRWVGRGLAGAVLRNLLYDLWEDNTKQRNEAMTLSRRIPSKALAQIRREDAWEQLLAALAEVFRIGLSVKEFDRRYRDNLEILSWNGRFVNKRFQPNSLSKDLMIEGSGFLQWLSVYALAVNKKLDVLLLDEPDAHLHPALQGHLIQKLSELAQQNYKQVLLATHSTTILSQAKLNRVFRIEDRDYLSDESGRVRLFVGIGSMYAPRLDQLKRHQRLFLHDGPTDLDVLQAWANTLGAAWPDNLVCWEYKKDRIAREVLFAEFRSEIPGLRGLSLQDRDDYPLTQTKADLTFDNMLLFKHNLGLRRWRRRNIENYLLYPAAIARAAGRPVQEIQGFLQDVYKLAITSDHSFVISDCAPVLSLINGKEIVSNPTLSIATQFRISYLDIANAMAPHEIPDDAKLLIQQIVDLCRQ